MARSPDYHKRWREANPEKVAAIKQRYKERNPDKIRARAKKNNEERKEYRKAWYQANKARIAVRGRARNIEAKYGLTSDQWDDVFARQGESCAICRTNTPGGAGWATDHCHETNRVRGILCNNCNLGIGLFADDTARLRAAIAYLLEDGAVA
jgi:hypothetical protein